MRDTTLGLVDPFGYGPAYPEWIDVTTPAAGANASVTVAGGWSTRVLAARCTLATDANAANRLLTLDYLDARGNVRVRNGAGLVVTANTSAQAFEFTRNRTVAEWAANTPVFLPVLDVLLPSAFVIRFTVTNIQVADALTALSLYVEQFPTGAKGLPIGGVLEP